MKLLFRFVRLSNIVIIKLNTYNMGKKVMTKDFMSYPEQTYLDRIKVVKSYE